MAESTGEIGYIKKTIKDIISSDVETVQEVVDYEKTGFRGFPTVTITCSGNENLFYSSAENQRTFIFTLRVYEQIEAIPKNELAAVSDSAKYRAEQVVERVVDQLLNAFDTTTRFTMAEVADNGVEAVPSRWGYALLPGGWCRVAEVELRVKRTVTVV